MSNEKREYEVELVRDAEQYTTVYVMATSDEEAAKLALLVRVAEYEWATESSSAAYVATVQEMPGE